VKIIILVLFLCFCVVISQGYTSGYKWICHKRAPGGYACYSRDTIECVYPDQIMIWTKDSYGKKESARIAKKYGNLYKELNYTISKVKLNCNNRQIATIALSFYRKDGSVLDSAELQYEDWQSVTPESAADNLLNEICGYCSN
jgi:hypothetical protein